MQAITNNQNESNENCENKSTNDNKSHTIARFTKLQRTTTQTSRLLPLQSHEKTAHDKYAHTES